MIKCKIQNITVAAVVMAALSLNPVSAGVESVFGKGEYIMEDNQAIKDAQEIAYQEAMRSIAQQVGVSIKGIGQAEGNTLTNDELEMITTIIAKVNEKSFKKEIGTNGKIKIIASVRAELDTDQADKMLKDLVETRQASMGYEKVLAEYQEKQGQYNELQGQYFVAMKQNAKQMVREGVKLEREGNTDEAMKRYQGAIEADVSLACAYSHRGHIYRQYGENDLAMKDYDKAASLDVEDAGWHYGKAVLFEEKGRAADAVKEYRLFVEYADIMEYDEEITKALERIVILDTGSVD